MIRVDEFDDCYNGDIGTEAFHEMWATKGGATVASDSALADHRARLQIILFTYFHM